MVQCLGCGDLRETAAPSCARCGAGLASLCAACGAGNPALAKFCGGCGGHLQPLADAASRLPREKAERRQMTVLFADLVGSTQLARALDPEDWHRLVHEVHSQFGEVVAAHHGHVAQYLGDGLLAYFGYPAAAQDDARLAVMAGLALVRQAAAIEASSGHAVRVRVGIHTGPVVVGQIGSAQRREHLALGETPNLAARIQDLAPSNSVVVSRETHHLVDAFFRSTSLGTVVPKGFSEAVELHRILEESGVKTRLEAASVAGLTPLVGREAELKIMAEAWDLAPAKERPVLLLLGDPGLGKSRLIHVLREQLEPRRVSILELRCSEHGRNSPFHPLIEALQRRVGPNQGDDLCAKLDQVLGPAGLSERQIALVRSLLGVPLPAAHALPPQLLHAGLVEALSAWIAGTATKGPTLFIAEDLHWADPSTLGLLAALVKSPPPGCALMVLSARPEFQAGWAGDEHVQRVALGRLDARDTRRLISLVAGGKLLPGDLPEKIASRADGIPLFLEEMTKSVLESGVLRETERGYELDKPVPDGSIPTTLHDSLMGRLDQLGNDKVLVQLAAVLGREFSVGLLESVWRRMISLPDIDVRRGLERIVAAQIISRISDAEPLYQFKHSLVQEAAYQSLLRSARRNYHLHTAGALRDEFTAQAELRPELIAFHYSAAQMDEPAAEFWTKAGQRSIANAAYVEAINQFGAALDHVGRLPPSAQRSRREIELRASLGVALLTTRGYAAHEVGEMYSRAALLCKEIGSELPLRVLYGVWAVNLVRGDVASVELMLPDLQRFSQSKGDSTLSLAAHAALGTWAFWRGDYARVKEHYAATCRFYDADQAKTKHEQLFREHGFEGLLYPHLYFAWSQGIVGDVEGAFRTWQGAAALGESIADPYVTVGVLAFGAAMNHDLGDLDLAHKLASRLHDLATEKGFLFWLAIAQVVIGHAMAAGDSAIAGIEKIEQGLTLFRNIGAKTPYAYYSSYLGEAYLAAGRSAQAIEVLEGALGMARTNVDRNYEPEILRLLGEARHGLDEVDAARSNFLGALDLARAQGARLFELRTATSLARLLRSQGDGQGANALLGGVRETFGAATEVAPVRIADKLLLELNQRSRM
jgi:class 3 adenylate cyclase/tetratricopeptide (TPR) repeat protein